MAFYKIKEGLSYEELVNIFDECKFDEDYTIEMDILEQNIRKLIKNGYTLENLKLKQFFSELQNLKNILSVNNDKLWGLENSFRNMTNEFIKQKQSIEGINFQRKTIQQELKKTEEIINKIEDLQNWVKNNMQNISLKDYSGMTRNQLRSEFEKYKYKNEYKLQVEAIERDINFLLKQNQNTLNQEKIAEKLKTLDNIQQQLQQNYNEIMEISKALTSIKVYINNKETNDLIEKDIFTMGYDLESIKSLTMDINNLKTKIYEKIKAVNSIINKEVNNLDWKVLNRIKEVLNKKGIDQNLFVDKLGMDRSTVSSLINNKTMTTMSNAFKIAYLLDTPIDELFYISSQVVWDDLSCDEPLFEEDIDYVYNYENNNKSHNILHEAIDSITNEGLPITQIKEPELEYTISNTSIVKNKIEIVVEGDKIPTNIIEEYFTHKGKVKKVSIEYEDIDSNIKGIDSKMDFKDINILIDKLIKTCNDAHKNDI